MIIFFLQGTAATALDLALTVEPHEEGTALHIRSASRKGYSDFGVNRRRVKRFFAELEPNP